MRIVFDLDGTLCTGIPYEGAVPILRMIEHLRLLHKDGNTIIIQTARGMGSNSGNLGAAMRAVAELTISQLKQWDIPYDELYFGKPSGDFYIDDKAINAMALLTQLEVSNASGC